MMVSSYPAPAARAFKLPRQKAPAGKVRESMWTCPKCGRQLKKEGQNHYCVKVQSVDAYISIQPESVQPILQRIRETIRAAAPEAVEKIAYQMPTYWQGKNLVHFAAHQKHIGLYPGDEAIPVFAERLKGYATSKGAIRLPLDRPIDYGLISDIVKWRVEYVTKGGKAK